MKMFDIYQEAKTQFAGFTAGRFSQTEEVACSASKGENISELSALSRHSYPELGRAGRH